MTSGGGKKALVQSVKQNLRTHKKRLIQVTGQRLYFRASSGLQEQRNKIFQNRWSNLDWTQEKSQYDSP